MKIIYNNLIPVKGFSAINLLGILFVRNDVDVTARLLNHERIHTAQMREMLFILFYVWYVVEWLVRLFGYGFNGAYREISFEREAYRNESDFDYLKRRKFFAWIKYLR